MASPGRRRTDNGATSLSSILAIILLLFSPHTFAISAGVLGIDIGTEYLKAALVKPGIPLEIVLTKDSKRKEASAIAFKASPFADADSDELPERLYGSDALALAPRFPADVYPNLKHLIGAAPPFREEAMRLYKQRYPALEVSADETSNGPITFQSKKFGASGSFTVEELLAMELKGIRQNAERMAGSKVRDAVITVPVFFTADEKRAMEQAAELAGLRVIGLITDAVAVGLNYATSRTFPNIDDAKKPEYHLVFDMGAGATTASVLRFQARSVKDVGKFNKTVQEVTVIGNGWDRTFGGDLLNDLIVSDMVQTFVQSSGARAQGIDVATIASHGRTMAKFRRESGKVRQVLSANTETSAFFESLYEDIDFRYKLSRSTFETMAADLVGRVGKPISTALEASGLKIDDLDSIILHGGAIRTPFVQSHLESLIKDAGKLKSNVNADEAAVFGAAFKAAGLSPSFKVKEIRDSDAAVYPVSMRWTANGKERRQTIFLPTSSAGVMKQVPFKFQEDFSLALEQQVFEAGSSNPIYKPVLDMKTANLTASVKYLETAFGCTRNNITTMFEIRLSPTNGIPEIVQGTVSCVGATAEKKGGLVEGMKGLFGFGGDKDQQPLKADTEASSAGGNLPWESSSSTSTASASKAENTTTKVPTSKLQVVNIDISTVSAGLAVPVAEELTRIKDGLIAFDKSDKSRRLREETYNGLESYTYRVRDILTDSGFLEVSDAKQRSSIEALLASTNEWLQSEGASAGMTLLSEKLQGLKDLVDPIQKRKQELAKRPQLLIDLEEALNQTRAMVTMVKGSIEADEKALEAYSELLADASSVAATETSTETPIETSTETPTEMSTEKSTETLASTASDPLESLDDGTSTSTSTTSKFAIPTPDISGYAEDDVIRLKLAYDSIKEWLKEGQDKQSDLSASEDPAILSSDLSSKITQLQNLNSEMLRRKLRSMPRYSSSKSKSKTKTKSKSKKGKTTESSETASATANAERFEAFEEMLKEKAGEKPTTRDEL